MLEGAIYTVSQLHCLLRGLAALHASFFVCLCLQENILSNFLPEYNDLTLYVYQPIKQ